MKRIFHYLINCFLIAVKRNHKKMAKQSTRNLEALKAYSSNPEIEALYVKTEPLHANYHSLLASWITSKSYRAGSVQSFNDYLKTVRAKLEDWELQIRLKFKKNTPTYKTIFPNGRSFILEGTQEEIISKFTSFREVVENLSDLNVIHVEVKATGLELEAVYGKKNEKTQSKSFSTTELEQAYDLMGKALYFNMLQLACIFIDDTSKVEKFFDMSLLRTSDKDDDTPTETSLLVNIPINSSSESGFFITVIGKYLIMNRSAHSLQFYGAATATELPKTAPREILPGEEIEVSGAELGAPANKYLIFINPSTTATAQVEILEVE